MNTDFEKAADERVKFYESNYDTIGQWVLRPGVKVVLGDKQHRVCRFCNKAAPEVTFKNVAHAIPEAFGNRSMESMYECDACNEAFGKGIENELGNWSKPIRTMLRIRGKRGVPTLKKGGSSPGWRIEYGSSGFAISSYEGDPIFEVDEANKLLTLRLRRDAYRPVAVLKAFMKIGLTLMPEEEIGYFPDLLNWVTDPDHSRKFADQCPVIRTFQPGLMPNDIIYAFILRRKPNVTGLPYAHMVLSIGNETYQLMLPSKEHDIQMNGQSVTFFPFPAPGSPDLARPGEPRFMPIDLTGLEVVKGEIVTMQLGHA